MYFELKIVLAKNNYICLTAMFHSFIWGRVILVIKKSSFLKITLSQTNSVHIFPNDSWRSKYFDISQTNVYQHSSSVDMDLFDNSDKLPVQHV